MAKMMKPRFKQCRRLGLNVCGHPKAMKRAGNGSARNARKISEYGLQLLEKQRLAAYYGVLEKQMRRYMQKALKAPGQTGHELVISLECRLDNIVYRSGLATSIRQARQMVVHGHVQVNGAKVNIPSYWVKPGQVISLKDKSKGIERFKDNFETYFPSGYPYIEKDKDFKCTLKRLPEREEVPIQINDQFVVEFYSKSM